ncbi:MAG: membrane dipeptidase [Gemmatimonadetes bacterium]|nr:membrane dipeptidase [Gemmatimonadota bacterium]
MSLKKSYSGYKSFSYLSPEDDYRVFELADEMERVPAHRVPLSAEEERRVEEIVRKYPMISLHEHLGVFPADVWETPALVREGRMATAFEGLAHAYWDAVFDNLMDGICQIESRSGWKWTEVLHDLGIRACDLAHQDFLIPGLRVADILRAHEEGKVAWIAAMEGAAMIENELDRIDILYGFGVRLLGVTYSEANALGSGLKEPRDGGLTVFGRKAVQRMNKVGMLIDCSHAGDQTTLDTIEVSEKPIVLSHVGARSLWDTSRLVPDEILEACAAKGGIIGIEAAPNTTLSREHPRHGIESYMDHFEYVRERVGIDHVAFGPDTLYGDHLGLHHVYSGSLSLKESHRQKLKAQAPTGEQPATLEYVLGVENPTEASHNVVRWMVGRGYAEEDIAKAIGGNALRLLEAVWE